MTILELREKRAKAWEAAKAFLDSHRNEKGVLSAEDDAAYTRIQSTLSVKYDKVKIKPRLCQQYHFRRVLCYLEVHYIPYIVKAATSNNRSNFFRAFLIIEYGSRSITAPAVTVY